MQNYNPYGPPLAGYPEQQYMPQQQPGYGAPAAVPYVPEPAPYVAPAPYAQQPNYMQPNYAPQQPYAPQPYAPQPYAVAPMQPQYTPEPAPYVAPGYYGAPAYAQAAPQPYAQPAYQQQPVMQPQQNYSAVYAPQQQPQQQQQGFGASLQDPDGAIQSKIANQVAQISGAQPQSGGGFGISPGGADMMGGFDDLASKFFGDEPAAANTPPYSAPAGSYANPAALQQQPMPQAPPTAGQIIDSAVATSYSPGYAAPQQQGGYSDYAPPEDDIDSISGELQKALLRADADKIYTENNLFASGTDSYLSIENATSEFEVEGGADTPLFSDVSFSAPSSSCTAVVSDDPAARYALLYSAGTGHGLYDGDVDIQGVPMLQRRDLRSQMLYIDSDDMIPNNMTAMEFMMQCVYKVDDWPAAKQQRILRMLDDLGLSSNAMMSLRNMGSARKILYLLLATTMNSLVRCIVLNPQKMTLETEEIIKYRKVFKTLHLNGVVVLINDCDTEFTSALANRIVALRNGKLSFSGSFRGFVERYCQQTMTFDMLPEESLNMLASRYPSHSFRASMGNNTVSVTGDFSPETSESLVNSLSELGVDLGSITLSEVSFKAAREEFLRQ